jgi:hypothetical protein
MTAPYRNGFQTFVNNDLPPAIAGDFAGANIRASVLGGPGQFVAPPAGTTVGVFAWFDPVTGFATNYYKPNTLLGFIHRDNQGLITAFLGQSTMQVVPGNMVTGMNRGDFWGLFAGGGSVGQKVYADPVTGALTANVTGQGVQGSYTTAAVSGGVLTTTDANLTGSAAAVGQVVTGGTLPEGTYIASAGAVGGGTHAWNLANLNGYAIPNNASFTVTNTGVQETPWKLVQAVDAGASFTASIAAPTGPAQDAVMTVTAVGSGVLNVGDFINNAAFPAQANVQILQQLTGAAGSTGTYLVNYGAVVGSSAFTAVQGQLGKITDW